MATVKAIPKPTHLLVTDRRAAAFRDTDVAASGFGVQASPRNAASVECRPSYQQRWFFAVIDRHGDETDLGNLHAEDAPRVAELVRPAPHRLPPPPPLAPERRGLLGGRRPRPEDLEAENAALRHWVEQAGLLPALTLAAETERPRAEAATARDDLRAARAEAATVRASVVETQDPALLPACETGHLAGWVRGHYRRWSDPARKGERDGR